MMFRRRLLGESLRGFHPFAALDEQMVAAIAARRAAFRSRYPPTDITETPIAYELRAELPGVDKKSIHIELMDTKTLLLQSHPQDGPAAAFDSRARKPDWWTNERVLGAFSRTINFPTEVSGDAVKAVYQDGILAITIPKAKGAQSTRIPIE